MSTSNNLALLKEHLEELFPGKWLVDSRTQKNIATGIAEIDHGITHGLERRRISEWAGTLSSGKTSFLRSIVAQWCAAGMKVVYVDTLNRLQAKDWAFVDKGNSGAFPENLILRTVEGDGKFWVVRNLKMKKWHQDAFWATEQLIRANIFDVIIFDMASSITLTSKSYARLQRCLERSRAALILLKDIETESMSSSWGCHTRFDFDWSTNLNCDSGLFGITSIVPHIRAKVWKEGMAAANIEVNIQSHVSNRLFTHSTIPDRRTSKA